MIRSRSVARPAPGRSLRPLVAALALGVSMGVGPAAAAATEPATLTCDGLPRLIAAYLQNHVQHRSLSSELRDRVAESHLRRLDPSRALLLEEDAEAMRQALVAVFAQLGEDDCSVLEAMHRVTLEHYREMEAFVRAYVTAEDYEIDREAELVVDAEERGFPKTKEEREDLYRKLVHFQMSNYVSNDTPLDEAKEKLVHRYELMTKRAEELTSEDIYARFLAAFAASLDPHSSYLSADNLEDFKIHMGLSLEGIGAVLSSRDGYTVVEEVVPGGAADKNGQLKAKDRILAVAQEVGDFVDVVDMDLRDVVRLIRGSKGSIVRLSILRQTPKTERLTLELERDKIDLEQQAAKLRFESVERGDRTIKLAIIELPSFYGDRDPNARQATKDMERLLAEVNEAKADGLLLDLSRNGGGLLDHAVLITGYFLESAGVVAVGGAVGPTQVHQDPDPGILYSGPLVVLTSRITASAGEILAGAIKDFRRGVIVGDEHTFGKGSVQTVAQLEPGLGALKLTTALFFRPGGDSTQRIGVPADVLLPSITDTEDFGEGQQPYALPRKSIEPFDGAGQAKLRTKRSWSPIDDTTIRVLAESSSKRVGESEQFAEIDEARKEAAENDGIVRVADLLDSDDDKDDKDAVAATESPAPSAGGGSPDGDTAMVAPPAGPDASETPDEDALSPQALEALEILADLVSTSQIATRE